MTSKECFVYITLPNATIPITAGRYVLETDRVGNPLGRFVYGRSYLSNLNAVPLDPNELKLTDTTYQTVLLGGLFGAMRDAGPDHWGRRVIDKHAGRAISSELDYLLESPDDRAGALSFGLNQAPPAPLRQFNKTLDLAKLQATADILINEQADENDPVVSQIQDLMLIGTAMGGARPKAVVEDDDGLWLAKFNRTDDTWNNARVEHAMLKLGKLCGLDVADSKLVSIADKDVLLVKRFDREKVANGYTRARMISALTLLRASESYQERDRWSYIILAEELRRVVSDPKGDALELFKRMVFNALISNIDDHPRNHAFIAKNIDWKLSPAYDLTPSLIIAKDRRDLALDCGDLGRYANAKNLHSQHARFLLKADQAQNIIDTMTAVVETQWYKVCRANGVSEADTAKITGAFVYDGFKY
jgi:serine/threonine-protein kinase HipA